MRQELLALVYFAEIHIRYARKEFLAPETANATARVYLVQQFALVTVKKMNKCSL